MRTDGHIRVFIICLLISDLIQSLAGLTQIKWAMDNMIYEGHICSIQGQKAQSCIGHRTY